MDARVEVMRNSWVLNISESEGILLLYKILKRYLILQ